MNRQERRKIATHNQRLIKRFENRHFPKVEKALNTKITALVGVIKSGGISAGKYHLTHDYTNEAVVNAVTNLYTDTAKFFYRQTKKGIEKKGFLQNIIRYLSEHILDKITFKITQTLNDHLLRQLTTAIDKGLGIDETVRLIDNNEFTRFQAARIVRTEVNRAANIANVEAGKDSDFEMVKEWIAVKDGRTRGNPVHGRNDKADHWHMDGQVVDINQSFFDSRSGEYLKQPGDPNASAADTINCRCQSVVYAKRDEQGRLIPKKSRIYIDRNFSQARQIVTI